MSKRQSDQEGGASHEQMTTVPQLADRLQVKQGWVYAKAAKGEIPGAVRVGKYWRFRPDAIDRWLSK